MSSMLRRWTAFLDEERETYLLGLLRIAVGVLLVVSAINQWLLIERIGYFGDVFHIPVLPEAAVATRPVFLALLAMQALAGALASLGWLGRPALLGAASIGLYGLLCDRLDYHNNRYVLLLIALLLAFAPCDRSFVALAKSREPRARIAPIWAQRLIQLQVSLVYLASAGSKLLDADWRGGQVLHMRYLKVLEYTAAHGPVFPELVKAALAAPWFGEATSKAAIATELFLAIGLWLGPTRAAALWLGALLHFGIEAAARVELFSFLMWAAYLCFCVPELRERALHYDVTRSGARAFARFTRGLDWLARFRFEPSGATTARWGLCAVDRDGKAVEGFGAIALVARATPALFALWPVLLVLARLTTAKKTATSSARCDS